VGGGPAGPSFLSLPLVVMDPDSICNSGDPSGSER
jgi:hypothetical protein